MQLKLIQKVMLIVTISFSLSGLYADQTDDLSDDSFMDWDIEAPALEIFGTNNGSQDRLELDKKKIERLNPDTICDILTKGLGLTVNSNGGYGSTSSVNIRGFSGGRILVLINGIPMNSNRSGDFDLSYINVNEIERIEVIKGGSDTKFCYSGAVGGIINVITKAKNSDKINIYGGVSNKFYYPDYYYSGKGAVKADKCVPSWYDYFDTQNVNTGFGIGNKAVYYDFSINGNRAGNRYLYKDGYNITRVREHNEVYDASVTNSLTWHLPEYETLIGTGSFYIGNKNMPGSTTSTSVGKQYDYLANGSVSFDADKVGSEMVDTEAVVGYTHHSLLWSDEYGDSKHQLHSLFTVNRWGFIVNDWVTIRSGGDFTYDFVDSTSTGITNLFNGGVYVASDFNILKKVIINPFVKVIYYKEYPIVIPKLSGSFIVNDNVTIKNNFFRVFKMPTINDLYWPKESYAEGNPNLKYEDGYGGDLIVSYNRAGVLNAESSVYSTYTYNTIIWENHGGIYVPENIGSGVIFGSGHSLRTLFSKYVEFFTSYEFVMSFVLTEDFDFSDDKRLPYKPVHTFGFGATASWLTGNVTLSGNYQSERYTSTANVTMLNPVFLLNLDVTQKYREFTFFIAFKNILNQHYYLNNGYPASNGSVTLGVKFNYQGTFEKKSEI